MNRKDICLFKADFAEIITLSELPMFRGVMIALTYRNIEASIKWLCSKKLIQQAVTLASEYIQEKYLGFYEDCNFYTSDGYYENKSIISYLL